MGDTSNHTILLARSERAWRSLFDGDFKGGFFRPKDAEGRWEEAFDEFAWEGSTGQFTEASAWQYRFYVPHQPEALAADEALSPPPCRK